jgi:hypothetical protein
VAGWMVKFQNAVEKGYIANQIRILLLGRKIEKEDYWVTIKDLYQITVTSLNKKELIEKESGKSLICIRI